MATAARLQYQSAATAPQKVLCHQETGAPVINAQQITRAAARIAVEKHNRNASFAQRLDHP
jgi:hypothetical protein